LPFCFLHACPQKWQGLVLALVTKYPESAKLVLYDPLNEPDIAGLAWKPQGTPGKPGYLPGMTDAYLSAMNAIKAVNPGTDNPNS
jgi:hypothetical protein